MDAGALIEAYGYWAPAVGCFLEGESLLAIAGFAAHRGHLDLGWVIAIATACAAAGDQCFFWLGRRHCARLLGRFASLAAKTARVRCLAQRYDAWLIVGLRFAYGLRIAGPILLGTTDISASRFTAFNALGAVIWATSIACLGWLFGHAFESLLETLPWAQVPLLLGAIAAIVVVWWLWGIHRQHP